jgi:uncharacterized protein (TIGR02145 family)
MKKILFVFLVVVLTAGCKKELYDHGDSLTDIDENVYETVIIGDQEWMAENLRTTKYSNGDPIPLETDVATWISLTTGAYCWYDNNNTNETPYGKLYNWYVVADNRNVCPVGWHVASDAEFTVLTDYLGGESVAGNKMKSISNWNNNGNGTNESGFNAFPGGYCYESGSFCCTGGYYGYWWSSSEANANKAWGRGLRSDGFSIHIGPDNKDKGYSVRCIKD